MFNSKLIVWALQSSIFCRYKIGKCYHCPSSCSSDFE